MERKDIKQIIDEIRTRNYLEGDLSDLGNEIGIIVGKYICDDLGFDKDDFISGIRHGISLSDGTHPKFNKR